MSGYNSPDFFINRELSWLEFNNRVLLQALNTDTPLFERIKFLAITCSNLDEFFMVRVASIRDQLHANYNKPDSSGLTPKQQIKKLYHKTQKMSIDIYSTYNFLIENAIKKHGINILKPTDLNLKQIEYVNQFFAEQLFPVLTPIVSDKNRSFPLLLNKSLNIGILLEEKEKEKYGFATVQVPSILKRMIKIDSSENAHSFILIEDIIRMNIHKLFENRKILSTCFYRITRNADLDIEEEGAEDLLQEIKKSLKKRKWGSVIRLEASSKINNDLLKLLKEYLEVSDNEIYLADAPLNLDFLMKELYPLSGFNHLKYVPFIPNIPEIFNNCKSIFDIIANKDVLLHHPFDSFDPVIKFMEEAANDPSVLAIKQTLYRVSGNSPIVSALAKAAQSGKQVTALLEVKARFDEENNINWGEKLEKAGCHVIYGLPKLKTHSKITLIVRREQDEIKRYLHLGTGNYNDVTAKLYTDFGLFTCDEGFCNDAATFFNTLTSYSTPPKMQNLIAAPVSLRDYITSLIYDEIEMAKKGKKAEIFAKMNSLVDTGIIKALYKASSEGVKIKLIVRGICCLKPNVKNVSENITVRSIVSRFLEHSRVYYFYASGKHKVFLSSADMMPRNLDKRVELLFPIRDKELAESIMNTMDIYWHDNHTCCELNEKGKYINIQQKDKPVNSQEMLIKEWLL